MKPIALFITLCIASNVFASGSPQIVKRDNGTFGGNQSTKLGKDITGWEETAILQPKGPCTLDEIDVYLDGTTPGQVVVWVMADPSEGSIPPTGWVRSYAALCGPITVDYDGNPGWVPIDVKDSGLRSDGFDRLCIQHTVTSANGPYFALDKSASTNSSFLMNPNEPLFQGLTIPGKYYLANANFMVRMLVRYEFPAGNTSALPPAATFGDHAKDVGLVVNGKQFASARASVADWNGDGWDDIVTGGKFFQNNGDGTFKNVTATIGIDSSGGGYVWGDFNGDGFLDCYSINGGAGDKIFAGQSDGTFKDVTASTKISNPYPTITPMWFDYDKDGNLDLYISNGRTADTAGNETYYPDQLWHNNGDGTFENVTQKNGISDAEQPPYYDCWASTVGDYNLDGYPDIFVADYRLQPDMLFRNNGGTSFTDVAAETGAIGVPTADPNSFGHGAGCEFADFNNDGLPDLFVGNLGHPDWRGQFSNPSLLFINQGGADHKFVDMHKQMGVKFFEMNFGVVTLDADLDGNLDAFHCQYAYNATSTGEPYRRSRIYINDGPSKNYHLTDKTWHLGCNIHGAWTAVRGDFDHDGDMDLVAASPTDLVRYFRNDVARNGKYLSIRLKGDPSQHVNTDAYGTSMTIYANGKKWYRDLMSGGSGSTASQNSNEINLGLGQAPSVDSVVISWPNGRTATLTTLQPDHGYLVKYPDIVNATFQSVRQESTNQANIVASVDGANLRLRYTGSEAISNARIEVRTLLGSLVRSQQTATIGSGEDCRIDIGGLASGTYLVTLSNNSITHSATIVVTH